MELRERFALGERIGGGDRADVYRAHDRRLGHEVQLLLVRDEVVGREYVERVRREAEAASDIRHRNVVTILDHGVIDGRTFVVRELVHGATLEAVLARRGPLPEAEARDIAEQLARGLEAAHQRGVLHRDLDTGSVLIARDGTAKISDFGMPGAARHPAPEQVAGSTIDERADVYGLGAVLYQMLTGQTPRGRPVAPRRLGKSVGKTIDGVVMRALESDPARRFPTAASVAEALRPHRTAKSPPVAVVAPPPPEATVAQRREPGRLDPPPPRERIEPVPISLKRPAPLLDRTERIAWPRSGGPARRELRTAPAALLAFPILLALLVGAAAVARPRTTETPVLSATTTPVPTASREASAPPSPLTTLIPPVETTPEPTAPPPVATPAPPPPVVAQPPQPPAPVVPAPPNSPAATVRTFYELIDQERFDEAGALWSARMQASYPPSTNIYGRFDRTRQIVIRSISPTATSGGAATVAIDVLEVLDSGVTRRWVGEWHLVWDGTRWLMDAPSLRAG